MPAGPRVPRASICRPAGRPATHQRAVSQDKKTGMERCWSLRVTPSSENKEKAKTNSRKLGASLVALAALLVMGPAPGAVATSAPPSAYPPQAPPMASPAADG